MLSGFYLKEACSLPNKFLHLAESTLKSFELKALKY
jgi:hypothetical protein